jgi:hypothetical protein
LLDFFTEKLSDTLRLLTGEGGIEWDTAMPGTDSNRLPSVGEEGRVFTWFYHDDLENALEDEAIARLEAVPGL